MRIPILYVGNPEDRLWLTDDPDVSPERRPVLIDANGRRHPRENGNMQLCVLQCSVPGWLPGGVD